MTEIQSGIKRNDGFVWLNDAWEALPEDSMFRKVLPPPGRGSHYAGYGDNLNANSFFDQIHYIEPDLALAKPEQLKIGNHCCIGSDSIFMLGGNHGHPLTAVSQSPLFHLDTAEWKNLRPNGDIVLEDDVWIGRGVTIMSGVTIGQGARIQAGSMVVTDIPPYAIAGGVKATVKRYRFSPEHIDILMNKIRWTKWSDDTIRENVDLLLAPKPDWQALIKVANDLEKRGELPPAPQNLPKIMIQKTLTDFTR